MLRYSHRTLIAAGAALLTPSIASAAIPRLPVLVPRVQVRPPAGNHSFVRRNAGLGKILTTKDGGQVFGFDINQNGTDGVLASAQDVGSNGQVKVSVETFDQNTVKITKSFAKSTGTRNDYAVVGIFAGDVGLVTHFVQPKPLDVLRRYELMDPVSGGAFTGLLPLSKKTLVDMFAVNQTTSTSLLYVTSAKTGKPELVTADMHAKTLGKSFPLDPNLFSGANGVQLAQDTATNKAVFATSPTFGAVNGQAPIIVQLDLTTGKQKRFNSLNAGPFGAGYVNGLAVDSNTGIAVTTTELNAQVEFNNLKTQIVIGVQLPNTDDTSQLNSAVQVTSDPVNKVFLIGQPISSSAPSGSTIYVYDENGNLLETLNGFNFGGIGNRIAVNPSTRTGWVNGPTQSQLQQFTY